MKTIYVTITEFEENGGVLENGREIHGNPQGGKMGVYEFDKSLETDYLINITNGRISGTVSRDYYYVAIECTPIYK